MNSIDMISKVGDAAINIASGVQTILNADGDVKQTISGVLDLVNAVSSFLRPPYDVITQAVSGIFNAFLGGGSTDTATVIKAQIEKQTKLIVGKLESMKEVFTEELEQQTLVEMQLLAGVS